MCAGGWGRQSEPVDQLVTDRPLIVRAYHALHGLALASTQMQTANSRQHGNMGIAQSGCSLQLASISIAWRRGNPDMDHLTFQSGRAFPLTRTSEEGPVGIKTSDHLYFCDLNLVTLVTKQFSLVRFSAFSLSESPKSVCKTNL